MFVENFQAEQLSVTHAPLALFGLLGLFSPTMDYVRHISEALKTPPEPFIADDSWAELGQPTTTLAKFTRGFSALTVNSDA